MSEFERYRIPPGTDFYVNDYYKAKEGYELFQDYRVTVTRVFGKGKYEVSVRDTASGYQKGNIIIFELIGNNCIEL